MGSRRDRLDLRQRGSDPSGTLDLLVVDEAGQFSLASTIAAAGSAQRLLLLGDPQQLPQVSQGRIPSRWMYQRSAG